MIGECPLSKRNIFHSRSLLGCCLAFLCALAQPLLLEVASTQAAETSAEFLDVAEKLLPVEDRYDYHKTFLDGSIHRLQRDPSNVPSDEEIAVENDWQVVTLIGAGPLTEYAAADMVEYFKLAMNVTIAGPTQLTPATDAEKAGRCILAGTKEGFARLGGPFRELGASLRGSKDYEIRIVGDRIEVCGWDDAGVMHGLFNVQSRMNLREGPFLVKNLQAVRHSRYQTRMILSWLGWMQWPDKYLEHLAHDGFDAIYASVYANPNGVEGPPHYDLIRKQDPAKLNELVRRARKYGIRVYSAVMFNNTGEEANKAELRELVRDIVKRCPDVAGYILLTEGFYYKKFFGAGGHGATDLTEWSKAWTEAVGIVAEECHKINPDIEVVPWEYNIDFRPERVELKRNLTGMLPQETIPLITWENGKQFELDGYRGFLRDYSISRIGPSEVAAAQIAEAKRRGMKIYCKADSIGTWQFGTTPYLPCVQQWQRRYDALAEKEIDGTMESWSTGYKPCFLSELRCWSCWTGAPPNEVLLKKTAAKLFGRKNAEAAIAGWESFSQAMELVPDTGPSMGTNSAVSQPLFFDKPPPRVMTLHNSWWDEDKKTPWRHRIEEGWPFAHHIMVFMPDFTNHRNVAETYARVRSGIDFSAKPSGNGTTDVLETFEKYLLRAADEMEAGLRLYRDAAAKAPSTKQATACKEVLLAEQMQRMLRSTQAILRFEDLRLEAVKANDPQRAASIRGSMVKLIDDETVRTREAWRTARLDSRLGYQCEMDYVYTPMVIEQKLQVLEQTRARLVELGVQ